MLDELGATELTRRLRKGYKIVRAVNQKLAADAGVPASIRVTTIRITSYNVCYTKLLRSPAMSP